MSETNQQRHDRVIFLLAVVFMALLLALGILREGKIWGWW